MKTSDMTELEKMDVFRQFTDFNDSELEIIMPYFEAKTFKKKTHLLDIGKVLVTFGLLLCGRFLADFQGKKDRITIYHFDYRTLRLKTVK
jgi:hypothetical protein